MNNIINITTPANYNSYSKIACVKAIRAITYCGLKEAIELVKENSFTTLSVNPGVSEDKLKIQLDILRSNGILVIEHEDAVMDQPKKNTFNYEVQVVQSKSVELNDIDVFVLTRCANNKDYGFAIEYVKLRFDMDDNNAIAFVHQYFDHVNPADPYENIDDDIPF